MTMNDDTVIGRIEITQGGYREVTVRLSDLDEPYREAVRLGLHYDEDTDEIGAKLEAEQSAHAATLAELEDENKRLREGLSSICDTDTPHTIDRYTRRIVELEALLEKANKMAEGIRHWHQEEGCPHAAHEEPMIHAEHDYRQALEAMK